MSYINQIVQLLQLSEFIAEHEYIEIAKGKYKLHSDIKGTYNQAKRELKVKRITNGRN
jgi:hypothetical protein